MATPESLTTTSPKNELSDRCALARLCRTAEVIRRPAHLKRTVLKALLVGSWLTFFKSGRRIGGECPDLAACPQDCLELRNAVCRCQYRAAVPSTALKLNGRFVITPRAILLAAITCPHLRHEMAECADGCVSPVLPMSIPRA